MLAWGFALSVAFHLALFGGYEAAKRFNWLQYLHLPKWLQSSRMLSRVFKEAQKTRNPPPTELPLVFVEVNPAQAVTEAPKDSKYYSDKNSKATNPDPEKETNTPKIDGKQSQVVKTEDVPRTKAFPLQPAAPAAPEPKEAQEEAKPKPAYKPGDLALAKPQEKPEEKPRETQGDAPQERPRTIQKALAQLNNNQLAGRMMQQEGGVRHRGVQSSLDVSATAFGAYDAAIIAAVQNRWYYLLDTRNFAGEKTGRVTLRFRLHADGSVSQVGFVENTTDLVLGLLCQSAVVDPAPYAAWPSDMRHKIGADYREVTFTFIYY